ncbi:MAG: DNA methyltransferase [Erysipelothrix sp.]|nr:DNA methyltransferase [Erysipelothrix sp.]
MPKIVVWSLFDSGNGSYTKVFNKYPNIDNYSIGIDRQNKNNHFIELDLSDYSYMFGEDKLINTLDKLPKPDIIIASPPCESWSVASSMKHGNACWKQETAGGLFQMGQPLSRFTIRDFDDYDGYQFYPDRQLITRINGELTIFNTIKIIKTYNPYIYIVENPAYGRIWDYIDTVLGFRDLKHENLTFYNNYNDWEIKKPTKFASNIFLGLKNDNIKSERQWDKTGWDYNKRSEIPNELVKHIIETSISRLATIKKKEVEDENNR